MGMTYFICKACGADDLNDNFDIFRYGKFCHNCLGKGINKENYREKKAARASYARRGSSSRRRFARYCPRRSNSHRNVHRLKLRYKLVG